MTRHFPYGALPGLCWDVERQYPFISGVCQRLLWRFQVLRAPSATRRISLRGVLPRSAERGETPYLPRGSFSVRHVRDADAAGEIPLFPLPHQDGLTVFDTAIPGREPPSVLLALDCVRCPEIANHPGSRPESEILERAQAPAVGEQADSPIPIGRVGHAQVGRQRRSVGHGGLDHLPA